MNLIPIKLKEAILNNIGVTLITRNPRNINWSDLLDKASINPLVLTPHEAFIVGCELQKVLEMQAEYSFYDFDEAIVYESIKKIESILC